MKTRSHFHVSKFALALEGRDTARREYGAGTPHTFDEVGPAEFAKALGMEYAEGGERRSRLLLLRSRPERPRTLGDVELIFCDKLDECLSVFREPPKAAIRDDPAGVQWDWEFAHEVFPSVRLLRDDFECDERWRRWREAVGACALAASEGGKVPKALVDQAEETGRKAVEAAREWLRRLHSDLHPAKWPIMEAGRSLSDAIWRWEVPDGIRGVVDEASQELSDLALVAQPGRDELERAGGALDALAKTAEERGLDEWAKRFGGILSAFDEDPVLDLARENALAGDFTDPDFGTIDFTGLPSGGKAKARTAGNKAARKPRKATGSAKPSERGTLEHVAAVLDETVKAAKETAANTAVSAEAARIILEPPSTRMNHKTHPQMLKCVEECEPGEWIQFRPVLKKTRLEFRAPLEWVVAKWIILLPEEKFERPPEEIKGNPKLPFQSDKTNEDAQRFAKLIVPFGKKKAGNGTFRLNPDLIRSVLLQK